MDFINLTKEQKYALKQIGKVGAENAANSMSMLVNRRINMNVTTINVVGFDEMMELIGGADELIVGILFELSGDITGTVYFILTVEEAESLIKKMTNIDNFSLFGDGPSDEFAISALSEAGNILTGSYLAALSDFVQLDIMHSIPHISVDMAGAVLTVGLVEISKISDDVMVIETDINGEQSKGKVRGKFFLLPDPGSLTKIFDRLGIEDYEQKQYRCQSRYS